MPPRTYFVVTAVEIHQALGAVFLVSAYKPPTKELLYPDLAAVSDTHRRAILAGGPEL